MTASAMTSAGLLACLIKGAEHAGMSCLVRHDGSQLS